MDITKALEELKLKNYDEAVSLFRDAAENGNGDACDFMVQMYLMNLSSKATKEDALQYAIKGYELRSKDSCFNMGTLYHNGLWGIPDYSKAYEFFLEGSEDYHDARCSYQLGEMLRLGEVGGTPKVDDAIKYYGEAAAHAYYPAQFILAKIFEGVVKDFNVTLDFYKQAAENGHVDAMLRLGVVFEKGIRMTPNVEEALKWYEKAADNGSDEATLKIAKICINPEKYGSITEVNLKRSYKLLTSLVVKDNQAEACFLLAMMYENGKGTRKNYKKAQEYYYKAAECGLLQGLYKYATLLLDGSTGTKDLVKGFSLLHVVHFMLTSHSVDIHKGDDLISADELMELTEKILVDMEYELSSKDKELAFKMVDDRLGQVFGVKASVQEK